MHLQSLAKIESGTRPNPTWDTVLRLAEIFGVTPDAFLGDDAAEGDDDDRGGD